MIELLRPIAKKLLETFTEHNIKFESYMGAKEQGVNLPCFFISLIHTDMKPMLDNRYRLLNLVNVTYISETENMLELEDIRFKMLFALRQVDTGKEIDTGKPLGIEAVNMQTDIEDGSVVFTGTYGQEIEILEEPKPDMRILQTEFQTDDEIYEERKKQIEQGIFDPYDPQGTNPNPNAGTNGIKDIKNDPVIYTAGDPELMHKINKDRFKLKD